MEETAFPRGGQKRRLEDVKKPKTKELKHYNENLFNKVPKESKTKKRRKVEISRSSENKKSDMVLSDDVDFSIEPLTVKMLMPGMLIMGCISSIQKYALKVSLPNNLFGYASIVDISDPYNLLLKRYTENCVTDDTQQQSPPPLKRIFSIGTYVVCKIKSIRHDERNRLHISLTLNPRELYDDVPPTQLYSGMLLTGAVESVEDHGYVINIGIPGVAAFLKHKDVSTIRGKKGSHLTVGQLLLCVIRKLAFGLGGDGGRVLELVAQPLTVSKAVVSERQANIMTLVPGTMISVDIQEVMPNGLGLTFGDYKGVVIRSQLNSRYPKPDQLPLNKTYKGRILCIHPITKLLYVSLQDRFLKLFPRDYFGGLRIGDQVDNAEVTEVIKNSVCFRLLRRLKGIATVSDLPVRKNLIKSTYIIGSIHKCVVKNFKPMDGIVHVSLKKNDFNKVTYHLEDLALGDVVECSVVRVQDSGIVVVMEGNAFGLIPLCHACESTTEKIRKHYKVNTTLQCRVLSIDAEKELVLLTNNKSIVESKSPVISSYEDVHPNMVVEGWVTCIRDNGIILRFYNSLQGRIDIHEVQYDKTKSLQDAFKEGQVVKCMVSSVERNQIELTMKIPGETYHIPPFSEGFSVGKITPEELVVELIPSGVIASLPMKHLSDYDANCLTLLQTFKIGDVIEKVVCFSNKLYPIVTKKQMFIDWVEKGEAVTDISSLMPEMVIPAVIHNVTQQGIFVQLLNDMKAIVPNKYVCCSFTVNPTILGYQFQQSVKTTVVEVNKEDKKICLSMASPKTPYKFHHDDDFSDLEEFLLEQDRIREYFLRSGEGILETIAKYRVGTIVDFLVRSVNEHYLKGTVNNSKIRGLSTICHVGSVIPHIGQTVEAAVIGVDFYNRTLELLLHPSLVKDVRRVVNVNGVVSRFPLHKVRAAASVLTAKPDYTLLLLRYKPAALGYMPSKQAFNDTQEITPLPICGQTLYAYIKRISHNFIMCKQGCRNCKTNGKCFELP